MHSPNTSSRVDLRAMGIWGKTLRVEFADRYEEVWIQTIGDRTEALEHGHEAMQRKLLEFRPGSERADALTEALRLAPPEDLAELVLGGERAQMESQFLREVPDPVTPRQDTAARESDEAFAKRLAEHQHRCRELSLERLRKLDEQREARRAEFRSKAQDELVELARPRRIDIECWNAFARACDDWVLLRAVRRTDDRDQPYFHDISEVQALHSAVKEQLRLAYRALEPPEGEALPKSSAASPSSASTT